MELKLKMGRQESSFRPKIKRPATNRRTPGQPSPRTALPPRLSVERYWPFVHITLVTFVALFPPHAPAPGRVYILLSASHLDVVRNLYVSASSNSLLG